MTTLQELQEIFRYQTTATEDFTPKDTVDYMLFSFDGKVPGSVNVNEMEKLVELLKGYNFDGYGKDAVPNFVKPDSDL